ncbi:MAG: permease [Ardenticatenaceae bacterium]|nr:permease [Anaerolineales bacterium]MCB8920015.1 permease [Ardenticatenaceae bacterium]MCB8989860.1 permease [Ardenticatenaceae bacterium]
MTTHPASTLQNKQNWRLPLLVLVTAVLWLILWGQLQNLADWFTYQLIGLSADSHLGQSLNFFVYDVPKILLLLTGMIFLVTLARSFFSAEQARAALGGRREGFGNLLAAGLGVITPFCSCSAVPLFIGFVESGIPLGVTFSFLIATPVINEIALAMLFGLFGWKVAALYLVSGLVIAVLGGILIGRLKPERYVEEFVWQVKVGKGIGITSKLTLDDRIRDAGRSTREIVSKVWLFVVIGIGIGAGIHGYVPEDFLVDVMGRSAWWSVPAAVLLGIPLYSNAAGIIPIAHALMEKGAALGTVLAFMMSVVALSLPEMLILKRVIKLRLIIIFIGIVAAAIVFTGYLFNLVIG